MCEKHTECETFVIFLVIYLTAGPVPKGGRLFPRDGKKNTDGNDGKMGGLSFGGFTFGGGKCRAAGQPSLRRGVVRGGPGGRVRVLHTRILKETAFESP